MATMNISLPDEMKASVEDLAAGPDYAGTSDYVRDLIRRDLERRRALEELRIEIQKGLDSGIAEDFGPKTFLAEMRAKHAPDA